MASASELFSNWRSRAGRIPGPDPSSLHPFPSDHCPDLLRPHCRRSRPRSLRREAAAAAAGRSRNRASQQAEHAAAINGDETNEASDISAGGIANGLDSVRLFRRDRLPHAVLQAQARVCERLRGISLVGGRQDHSWDDLPFSDVFGVINMGDSSDSRHSYRPAESEGVPSFLAGSNKRPPGLSKEAIGHLQVEIFRAAEDDDDDAKRGEASPECSICLEGFYEGDELMRLYCGHGFHVDCLEPWVRRCGDCPYCRRSIL